MASSPSTMMSLSEPTLQTTRTSMQRPSTTTSLTCKYSTTELSYTLSIFSRLKKQYRAVNERIGKTGAGLKPEDITPGSEIANLIGMSISVRCYSCESNQLS